MTAAPLNNEYAKRLQSAPARGPWVVEPCDGRWAVRRPGSAVVFMWRKTEALAQKACDEANERFRLDLIRAAAPELLDALRAVVAVADRKTVEFDMARAAIAKAEGRS